MIIIKIIILYFIQITHTDDFPSTGTRLVFVISENYFSYNCIEAVSVNGKNRYENVEMYDGCKED